MTFFCSEACRSATLDRHRARRCSDLQEIAACEVIKMQSMMDTGELGGIQMPTMLPRSSYKPLRSIRSWKEYFDFSSNPLAQCIDENFEPVENNPNIYPAWRTLKAATEASSFILTVLAGLESSIPDLANRTTLTLHVVGPSLQELQIQRMNEELLHLLPNLKHLIIGLIGPDFPVTGEDSKELMSSGCCPECTTAGRTRQIFFSRSLYHDFFSKNPLGAKHALDMLVAFNSGHADVETHTWRPTLLKILDIGKPAVFTTYNRQEAVEEGEVLQGLGAAFKVKPEENRWRGLLPYLDCFMARYETYHQNFWWYVIEGRSEQAGGRGEVVEKS